MQPDLKELGERHKSCVNLKGGKGCVQFSFYSSLFFDKILHSLGVEIIPFQS